MAHDEAYREAEKKIEEVRHKGKIRLDLSAPDWIKPKLHQITELPGSLGQLTELRFLKSLIQSIETLAKIVGATVAARITTFYL